MLVMIFQFASIKKAVSKFETAFLFNHIYN